MRAQLLSVVIGVWLMIAPAAIGYGGMAAQNDRIIGPIAATFATIAASEATRPVRWANVVLGAWMVLASPWLGGPIAAIANEMLAGVALIGLSLVRGRISSRFGGGWSVLFRRGP